MQRYIDWLTRWNDADESELQFVMDDLEPVIVGIIGDCEIEGIETMELRSILAKHRIYKHRILDKRMDVAEELDFLLKRIAGERFRESQEAASDYVEAVHDTPIAKTPKAAAANPLTPLHPYKAFFAEFVAQHPDYLYPEAEAAKEFWNTRLSKSEIKERCEGRTREEAMNSFVRSFKYVLKK